MAAAMWLSYDAFADLVVEALDGLPEAVRGWLDNVEVVVEDWPTRAQLAELADGPDDTLFGLYEGVPRTARGSGYGMVLPDKVTLFRGPILDFCRTPGQVREEVRHTVVHELAHHFGIDDDRLHELGAY
jgi:predicted Zn-dependent protease with MMP-like domain